MNTFWRKKEQNILIAFLVLARGVRHQHRSVERRKHEGDWWLLAQLLSSKQQLIKFGQPKHA
jgi:hypothetical protein